MKQVDARRNWFSNLYATNALRIKARGCAPQLDLEPLRNYHLHEEDMWMRIVSNARKAKDRHLTDSFKYRP